LGGPSDRAIASGLRWAPPILSLLLAGLPAWLLLLTPLALARHTAAAGRCECSAPAVTSTTGHRGVTVVACAASLLRPPLACPTPVVSSPDGRRRSGGGAVFVAAAAPHLLHALRSVCRLRALRVQETGFAHPSHLPCRLRYHPCCSEAVEVVVACVLSAAPAVPCDGLMTCRVGALPMGAGTTDCQTAEADGQEAGQKREGGGQTCCLSLRRSGRAVVARWVAAARDQCGTRSI
jgi:hypothetical protein